MDELQKRIRAVTDPGELERFQAEAVRWLIDRGATDLALGLARSRLLRIEDTEYPHGRFADRHIQLEVPEEYRERLEEHADYLSDEDNEYLGPGALQAAFEDLSEDHLRIRNVSADVLALPDTGGRHQASAFPGSPLHEYRGTRYRSKTEIRIAEALDDANVLYFPLPLGIRHFTRIAEPDFLVISFGRIGVLEIDGPHHTPLTRAQEDAKAAKLLQSGVRLVHHVPVKDVDRDPANVVKNFLALLQGPIL